MADKEEIFRYSSKCFKLFCLLSIIGVAYTDRVIRFESQANAGDGVSFVRHIVRKREAHSVDAKCQKQENDFLNKNVKIDNSYVFQNESKYAMALAWAGENDGVLIVVTSKDDVFGTTVESSIYRSTDFGAHFEDITTSSGIEHAIRKHSGLQRNAHDAGKVYLVAEGTVIYITENGGLAFTGHNAGFTLKGELIFHSSPDFSSFLLAICVKDQLHISFDNGKTWAKILSNVEKVFWGVLETASNQDPQLRDTEKTVYAAVGGQIKIDPILKQFFHLDSVTTYTLKKSTDGGTTWTTIRENVISFERQGHFLYASVLKDPNAAQGYRLLQISTDGGATWHEAQLPTIEHDRFYSVMDVEDNMIFMHVDNPKDTGHGTLYTSANQGIVYSESLPMHLYPNFGETHDFYKVKSLRGVYITSQMTPDNAIHTVITYNRGGTWQKIPRPGDGTTCKDETKDCYLQLHGMYSMKRGIQAIPPLTESSALGIILAHGHVSDSLQKTAPDVYVSSDGGYNWQQSLKGPHHYSIGDHGGFLAAVPMEPSPKIVKFSTDEGGCWHEYTFTNKTLNFTGMLTEPEGKSSVVMLWGYSHDTRKWEVHVIDFKDIIPRQCGSDDYEVWMAHSKHRMEEGVDIQGCLLGKRETFERLKADSWCYNGFDHERRTTVTACTCTRQDYECDYGFFRPGGSDSCMKMTKFTAPKVDICLRGHEERIVSEGYRKIPGDSCRGGFSPHSRDIDMDKACSETSKELVQLDETEVKNRHVGRTVVVVIFVAVISMVLAMSVFFIRKYILLRKHRVEYRYSLLDQSQRDVDRDMDSALSPTNALYQDSDEEVTSEAKPPPSPAQPLHNGSVKKYTKSDVARDTNPFQSYHDDSDDDMLS